MCIELKTRYRTNFAQKVQDSTRMGHASFSTRQNPNLIELPIVFAVSLMKVDFLRGCELILIAEEFTTGEESLKATVLDEAC